jgi:hypothetical protein
MERFAQMAGASRSHGSEMAAFLWLRDNDPDVNRQLHHLARASVAAARAGDKKQFALTFAELAGQGGPEGAAAKPGAKPDAKLDPKTGAKPDAKAEAAPAAKDPTAAKPRTTGLIDSPEAERLYRTRQREQSLSWQRAMLIVARDALPSLVDNDDQTNLKILVDRLQQHLTAHGRGPVDAELTTVYRAASAHLKTGARAYAERVGKTKRPLLLGEIAVERHYDVSVPRVTVTPRGPRSLLWVPVAGNDPSAARLRHWTAPLGVTVAATGTTGLASATASAPAPAPAKAAPTVGTP